MCLLNHALLLSGWYYQTDDEETDGITQFWLDTTGFFTICGVSPPAKYLYVVHQSYGVGLGIASLASLVPFIHTI